MAIKNAFALGTSVKDKKGTEWEIKNRRVVGENEKYLISANISKGVIEKWLYRDELEDYFERA